MTFYALGINYLRAPVEVRESFASAWEEGYALYRNISLSRVPSSFWFQPVIVRKPTSMAQKKTYEQCGKRLRTMPVVHGRKT